MMNMENCLFSAVSAPVLFIKYSIRNFCRRGDIYEIIYIDKETAAAFFLE